MWNCNVSTPERASKQSQLISKYLQEKENTVLIPAGLYKLKRRRSGVLTFNFEHISHLVLVLMSLTLNMELLAGLTYWNFNLKCDYDSKIRFIWKEMEIDDIVV